MTPPRLPWPAEERERVRQMVAAGKTSLEVSTAIGRSRKATIDGVRKYGLGRWMAKPGKPPSSRPAPDDFAQQAAKLTFDGLRVHYRIGSATTKRWLQELGAAPFRKPAYSPPRLPMPDGFALTAPTLTMKQARTHYGRGEDVLNRWAIEAGICFRTPRVVKAVPGLNRVFAHHQADMSRAAQAARFIQRKDAIWRCNEAGKQGPGQFWMLFGRVRTDAEIIERAERLGWDPDAWKRLNTPIPTTNEGARA